MWINVLAGCAVWLAPLLAWADMPWADPLGPNFGWLALGELVPVTIEAALLRRWLKLPFWVAFKAALCANGASFILGLFIFSALIGTDPTYWLLGNLSDLYFERGPLSGSLAEAAAQTYGIALWTCMFSIVVEIFVYPLALGRKLVRGRDLWAFIAINLISYPVYYGLTLLGVVIVLRDRL